MPRFKDIYGPFSDRKRCRFDRPGYKTIAPTYAFVQAIGHCVQGDDNVIQSTKLLRIILDALYDYVVR